LITSDTELSLTVRNLYATCLVNATHLVGWREHATTPNEAQYQISPVNTDYPVVTRSISIQMKKEGKPKKQTSIPIVFLKYCCLTSLTLRHDLPKIDLTFFIIYIYWIKYNKYYVLYLLFMSIWKLILIHKRNIYFITFIIVSIPWFFLTI